MSISSCVISVQLNFKAAYNKVFICTMYGFRIRVSHKGRHRFSSFQVRQALLDEWLSGKNLILYSSQAGTVVINPTSAVIVRGLSVSRLNWVSQFPYSSKLTLLVCLRCNKLYHINLNFFRDFHP